MHIIELKIHRFLEEIKKGKYKIPKEVLKKFSDKTQEALIKQFEYKPREFNLSMSNIGRPTCQLQFEQSDIVGQEDYNPIRNVYGYIAEELLMFLLHASGIKIIMAQEHVTLKVDEYNIPGTSDIVLDLDDGYWTVWDIKSASNWAFKNKFVFDAFDKILKEDTFGYGIQLLGYTLALQQRYLQTAQTKGIYKRIKVGGFIAFDKSSGEIGIIEAPREQSGYEQYTLEHCNKQIQEIYRKTNNSTNARKSISRCFTETHELWRKKPTGNKYLGITCEYCPYKFSCWDNLKLLPQINSESKNPKYLYYTEIKE